MILTKIIRHLLFKLNSISATLRSSYYANLIVLEGGKAGKGLNIRAGGRINIYKGGKAEVGNNLVLAEGAQIFVGPKGYLKIEDNVFIGRSTSVIANGRITIGANTEIAHDVTLIDSDHEFQNKEKINSTNLGLGKIGHITIGNDVWIGANAVILKNTEIGQKAVIGAAAVVTKNISANSVVAGNPAKPINKSSN